MFRGDIDLAHSATKEAKEVIAGQFGGGKLSASTFSFDDLGCSFPVGQRARVEEAEEENYGQQRVVNRNNESVPEWGAENFFTNTGRGGGLRVNRPQVNTWKDGVDDTNSSSSSSSSSSSAANKRKIPGDVGGGKGKKQKLGLSDQLSLIEGSQVGSFIIFRQKEIVEKINENDKCSIWCAEVLQANDEYDSVLSFQPSCTGSGVKVPWQFFVRRHELLLVNHKRGGFTVKKTLLTFHPSIRENELATGLSSWFTPPCTWINLMKKYDKKDKKAWSFSKCFVDFRSQDSPFIVLKAHASFTNSNNLSEADLRVLKEDEVCRKILSSGSSSSSSSSSSVTGPPDLKSANDLPDNDDLQSANDLSDNDDSSGGAYVNYESDDGSDSSELGRLSDDDFGGFGRFALAQSTREEIDLFVQGQNI